MNDFNQFNNIAIMAAIQEFYETRAATKAAAKTQVEIPAPAASNSRLAGVVATLRKIATTPLPLPWTRTAA